MSNLSEFDFHLKTLFHARRKRLRVSSIRFTWALEFLRDALSANEIDEPFFQFNRHYLSTLEIWFSSNDLLLGEFGATYV